MAHPPLIRLEGVGKAYPLAASGGDRLRTLWQLWRGRRATHVFQALSDISLELHRGQSLGLIGENGAGKSTLMKIIAGVVDPTQGTVERHGRIGALLELGAGFHPDYTGRENVFLAAALLGLTRAETTARLDDILAFADIGEHIEQPIKHYSSGMVVRLGFAIATTMKPDLLITDEVLAVGDESFQKKCSAWIEGYLADGGTLMLCSHSMYHIQKLCQKAAWIHEGRLFCHGDSADVTREYLAYHEERAQGDRPAGGSAQSGGLYALRNLRLNGASAQATLALPMASDLHVSGSIHSPDGRVPGIAVGVVKADGTPIYGLVSDMDGYRPRAVDAQTYAFELTFPALPLLPGRYYIRAHAMDPEGLRLYDQLSCRLDITGSARELGMCRLAHVWGAGADADCAVDERG